jgi:hypothetical protein
MKRLLVLALCCIGLLASAAPADHVVFFRGKKLTQRHYVYGEVTSATRTIGTVNLGYAHGLNDDQEIGVVRRFEGQLIPIGILRMTSVKAGESNGLYEGELPIRKSDMVIAAARTLNLWSGRSRMDQMVVRTMISDRTRGYDTGAVSPRLVREVGKDDDEIHRLPLSLHINQTVFDTQRPVVTTPIIRGAFAPAASTESANAASEEDRILADDKPTLDLEQALVRFVRSNAARQVNLSTAGARELAVTIPGEINLDEMQERLTLANERIRGLLLP